MQYERILSTVNTGPCFTGVDSSGWSAFSKWIGASATTIISNKILWI